jgi:hypothetical protein
MSKKLTREKVKIFNQSFYLLPQLDSGSTILFSPFFCRKHLKNVKIGPRFTDKKKDDKEEETPTGLSLVAATMKHMKKREQQLLILLTVWCGMQQGFFGADFTAVTTRSRCYDLCFRRFSPIFRKKS